MLRDELSCMPVRAHYRVSLMMVVLLVFTSGKACTWQHTLTVKNSKPDRVRLRMTCALMVVWSMTPSTVCVVCIGVREVGCVNRSVTVRGVQDGDAVVIFNFRSDRVTELSKALEYDDFTHFDRCVASA